MGLTAEEKLRFGKAKPYVQEDIGHHFPDCPGLTTRTGPKQTNGHDSPVYIANRRELSVRHEPIADGRDG